MLPTCTGVSLPTCRRGNQASLRDLLEMMNVLNKQRNENPYELICVYIYIHTYMYTVHRVELLQLLPLPLPLALPLQLPTAYDPLPTAHYLLPTSYEGSASKSQCRYSSKVPMKTKTRCSGSLGALIHRPRSKVLAGGHAVATSTPRCRPRLSRRLRLRV